MLKITLVKSVIGSKPVNRRTVTALGLRKTGRTVYRDDSPSVRGMIRNVQHLVKVEEVDATPKVEKKAKPVVTAAPAPKAKAQAKEAKPWCIHQNLLTMVERSNLPKENWMREVTEDRKAVPLIPKWQKWWAKNKAKFKIVTFAKRQH